VRAPCHLVRAIDLLENQTAGESAVDWGQRVVRLCAQRDVDQTLGIVEPCREHGHVGVGLRRSILSFLFAGVVHFLVVVCVVTHVSGCARRVRAELVVVLTVRALVLRVGLGL
jgi:hypothetical protein